MNLRSRGPSGRSNIDEYIDVYFISDTEKVGSQILTNSIQILGLKTIHLALGRIAIFVSLHQASQLMMFYAVDCMWPTIYDWSTTLLSNMKQQLSDCKMGRVQNFGFGSILSTFFFERAPGLSPGVDISPHGVWDPAQQCWANFMRKLRGGRVDNPYPT